MCPQAFVINSHDVVELYFLPFLSSPACAVIQLYSLVALSLLIRQDKGCGGGLPADSLILNRELPPFFGYQKSTR
jgi:hypothetical protein